MITQKPKLFSEEQLNECSRDDLLSIVKILMAQNIEVCNSLDLLTEQIRLYNHQRFGSSSEKLEYADGCEQMSLLFNEAEATADLNAEEPEFEEIVPKSYKRKKSKGKRETDLSDFPVVRIEHDLSDDEKVCSVCNRDLKEITVEINKRLRLIPAHFEVEEHAVHVYGCQDSSCGNIVRAENEPSLLRGSIATPSVVAAIMNGKYVNSLPLARQESEFNRNGVNLSRQTMANWMIRCSEDYLTLLYDEMKKHLLTSGALQADETRVQVLNEKGRKATTQSWMWIYRTGELCKEPPVILLDYETTRAGYHPKNFLLEYSGFLTVDGYEAYHNLPDTIIVSGCFAHARRKFDDYLKSVPAEYRKESVAQEALRRIAILYKIEESMAGKTAEERYEARLKYSKPVLDDYFDWLKSLSKGVDSGSLIGKAINYSLNQRKYLENYLVSGLIPIDNNASERIAKIFATGRKNWLFCNTPSGATASAVIYSITETAKANNLKPYDYLVHVLDTIKNHYTKTDRSFLKDLLPWSDKIPTSCKSEKKA